MNKHRRDTEGAEADASKRSRDDPGISACFNELDDGEQEEKTRPRQGGEEDLGQVQVEEDGHGDDDNGTDEFAVGSSNTDANEFNNEIHDFTLTTDSPICVALERYKSDEYCDLEVSAEGMKLRASYHSHTVMITTILTKSFFKEIICEQPTHVTMNFNVLAKSLAKVNKKKPQLWKFNNSEDNKLEIHGISENTSNRTVYLPTMDEPLDLPSMDDSAYPMNPIRVSTEELCGLIDIMPATFTIHMDCDSSSLVFSGTDDVDDSKTTDAIQLTSSVMKTICQHPSVAGFRETFRKSNMSWIMKGKTSCTHAEICFASTQPFFVKYNLTDTDPSDAEGSSSVSTTVMYISCQANDDDDDDNFDDDL